MFAMRYRSFNLLEQQLRRKKRWEHFVGSAKPSADTIGRVLSQISNEDIRQLLVKANRRSWRSKAIHMNAGDAYRVVALDGHELFFSTARCCPGCSSREVKIRDKTVVQYYHRVVVAQWVGVTPPAILDLEMIDSGEGEVVAARRLVKRLVANYSRLIDVITADSLYLEAPFIRLVLDSGKHVVIVMKQENRILFQDADQLRKLIEPKILHEGPKTTRMWDLPELSSFTTLGSNVRVVWAEESTPKHKIIGGKRQEVLCESTWVWVTDLPVSIVPATRIQRWGHQRWDVENRAFNELVTHWHANHCFKHDVNAIEALLLILSLAFLVTYLFYERNLKPEARRHMSRLTLAARFVEGLAQLSETITSASIRPG